MNDPDRTSDRAHVQARQVDRGVARGVHVADAVRLEDLARDGGGRPGDDQERLGSAGVAGLDRVGDHGVDVGLLLHPQDEAGVGEPEAAVVGESRAAPHRPPGRREALAAG